MTPKEKAIQLVAKNMELVTSPNKLHLARLGAMITVDEMIYYIQWGLENPEGAMQYWGDVKTEIANL